MAQHKNTLERRFLHISVSKDVHVELKRLCSNHRISMQDIIEFFVNGLVDGDEERLKILKEFIRLKKERKLNRIAKIEIDELFRQIAGEPIEDF